MGKVITNELLWKDFFFLKTLIEEIAIYKVDINKALIVKKDMFIHVKANPKRKEYIKTDVCIDNTDQCDGFDISYFDDIDENTIVLSHEFYK